MVVADQGAVRRAVRPWVSGTTVGTTIQLLGPPRAAHAAGSATPVRSQKTWALLAFLLLVRRPASRAELADLLYPAAEDPLRALRWNLTELRHALGPGVALTGDPVRLVLPADSAVDVLVLLEGTWQQAVALPRFGAPLLEGVEPRRAGTFGTWLTAWRHRVTAATQRARVEAVRACERRGDPEGALEHAVAACTDSPLDQQRLDDLVALYRLLGDEVAARAQLERGAGAVAEVLGSDHGASRTASTRP